MPVKLSQTEEQLMEMIWENKKLFMKEIMEAYPEPKPAASTVATLLKRMQVKGYVDFKLFGNSRQYFPLIRKKKYFKDKMKNLVNNFFGGSNAAFASFFAEESKMNTQELKELKALIERKIKDQ